MAPPKSGRVLKVVVSRKTPDSGGMLTGRGVHFWEVPFALLLSPGPWKTYESRALRHARGCARCHEVTTFASEVTTFDPETLNPKPWTLNFQSRRLNLEAYSIKPEA